MKFNLKEEIRYFSAGLKDYIELEVIFTDVYISTNRIVEYSFIPADRRAYFDFISTNRSVELLIDKDGSNSY